MHADDGTVTDVNEHKKKTAGTKAMRYLYRFLAKYESRRMRKGLITKYSAFLHEMESIAFQSRRSYLRLIEMSRNQSLDKITFCKSISHMVNVQIMKKSENISISNHNLRTWERILAHSSGSNQDSSFSDIQKQRALKEVNILRSKIKSENKMIELLLEQEQVQRSQCNLLEWEEISGSKRLIRRPQSLTRMLWLISSLTQDVELLKQDEVFLNALSAIDWRHSLEDVMFIARQAHPFKVTDKLLEDEIVVDISRLVEQIQFSILPRLRRFQVEMRTGNSAKYNTLKEVESSCRQLQNESNQYVTVIQDSKTLVALMSEYEKQSSVVAGHQASRSLFLETETDATSHAERLQNNKVEANLTGSESEYCEAAIKAMEDQAKKAAKHAELHEQAMIEPMKAAKNLKDRIDLLRSEMMWKNRKLKKISLDLSLCMSKFNRVRQEATYLARHLGAVENLIEQWDREVELRGDYLS
eukprot:761043-Hanusia_phi.AAC.3